MSAFEVNLRQLGLDQGDYWFYLVIAIALSFVTFFLIWRYWKRARIIEDTPTAKVRSAPQGYVELVGVGEWVEDVSIISPLKQMQCLWYDYKVQEKRSSGKNSHWVTIDSGTSDKPFVLKDETGECLVDPVGAEVTATASDTWYSTDPRVHGQENYKGLFGFHKRYRLIERRLSFGSVYAMGSFRTVTSLDIPAHEEVRDLLIEWKSKPTELLERFDANKDGQIDPQEWKNVRKQATHLIMQDRIQRSADPAVHMLEKPGNKQQPYLIAGKDQKDLASGFRWKAGGSLVGFILTFCASVYLVSLHF